MDLRLERFLFSDNTAIGKIYVNNTYECYTLEDKVRKDKKIFGETAIPYGRYRIIITYSNRFKRNLPLLVGVPDYSGIRIHPGNTEHDTLGCILPGQSYKKDMVFSSKKAFDKLFDRIQDAENKEEEIWIEIKQALSTEIVA